MENEIMNNIMEEATEEIIPVAQAIAEETVVPAVQEVAKETLPTVAAEIAAPVTKKAKHSPRKTLVFVVGTAVAGAAFLIKKKAEKKKAEKDAKEQERINAMVDKRVDEKLAALGLTAQQPATEETQADTNVQDTSTEETKEENK